jgi:hypothetical protein
VVRDAELGRRLADALVQVTLTSGEQRWIYVHIEVQGQRDADFAQRMFTYNYRLFDRYACPIASLAVLADDDDGYPEARYQAKRTLVRLLYQHGWERQRILDLFAVLDWMMRLPCTLCTSVRWILNCVAVRLGSMPRR